MKRFFTFITIMLVAFALVIPAPAQAEFRDFWAYVYTWDGSQTVDGKPNLTRLTTGVTFKVLATGSDTAETLLYYGGSTSLTNPVTSTNYAADAVCKDMVRFRVDPTDGSDDRVDLMVVDENSGGYFFFEDFNYRNDHTVIIDLSPGTVHHGTIWFAAVSSAAVSTETSLVSFPYDTAILSVTMEIVTTQAGGTMNVGLDSTGTGGDVNGFVAAMSTTTAGFPDNTITTVGDLLDDGTNVDPFGHTILSANEQTMTQQMLTGAFVATTAAGYVHYTWIRLR